MGTTQIVMPENYIAMFNAPEWDKAKEIIEKAEPSIEKASGCIEINKEFAKSRCNFAGRISSSVINPVFYKLSLVDYKNQHYISMSKFLK